MADFFNSEKDNGSSKGPSSLRNVLSDRAFATPKWSSPAETGTYQGSSGLDYSNQETWPKAPTGLPAPAPNSPSRVPPAWQRYRTGLRMQDAYANGWNPNPIMLRILEGKQ